MNTEAKKTAEKRYYIDLDEQRIVKAPSNITAINHFYSPKIRVATTDEVLAFKERGGKLEELA